MTCQPRFALAVLLCLTFRAGWTSALPPCDTIRSLTGSETFSQRSAAVRHLLSLEESAVRLLIADIPSDQVTPVILNAPMSSAVRGPLWRYCGVVAAYLVETMLSKTELILEEPVDQGTGFFLGTDNRDYVYGQGVIVRSDGTLISSTDLKRIHELYLRWWDARRGESLEEMRRDWREGSRPLTGSEFHWE